MVFSTNSFRILILSVCAAALAGEARGQSAIKKMTRDFGTGSDKVEVQALSMEYDLDSDWGLFKGDVAIRYQGMELRADEIRFHQKRGDAIADGKVIMVGDDGSLWHGEHIEVNIKDQSAKARNIDIFVMPFRVLADNGAVSQEIAPSGEKTKRFDIQNAVVSTCTNAPGHFHYQFRTSRLRARPDRDFTAWSATPSLFAVPFFWLPYYWRDLNRSYGFRFEPGYQSSWGPYLLSSHQMPLYWDKPTGTYFDMKTSVDYRYKRGFAYGERLRWGRAEESKGWLSAYYLNDEKLPFGVEDPERYRLRVNQSWNITPSDRFIAQGLYVSDDRFMHDFFRDEYREMGQPDNFLSYTHYANDYNFGLLGRVRLNDFYTQVERLPEGWFNLSPMEIADSGVYVENSTSAAFLRRRFDTRFNPQPEDYDALRVDSHTRVSMPLKLAGFLSVVPRAGYRATYYDKTLEKLVSSRTENVVSTNEYGAVETFSQIFSSTEMRQTGGDLRSVLELGAEVSFKTYGFWRDGNQNIWRHIVEPYADYSYIPEPNILPEQLYQFDGIDAINRRNTVRLGVRNRWQVKPNARAGAYERIYNNIYTDVNLDPDNGEKSLSSFYTETRFRPNSWLRADLDTRYNFDENKLDRASARLVAWHRVFDANFEYRYRASESSLFMASMTWHINNGWSVNGYGRYEFENSRVEELGTWIERRLDCIAFRLYASVQPGYEINAQHTEKDDYRVSLLVWLTDFVPENIRDSR